MNHRIPTRLAVAAVFLFPSSAFAEEHVTVTPVVVTATRTAQTADESLSSVSVITREEIERTQATSLPELLGRVQGVEFTQSGGRGTTSSMFIRGTNSDHVIVLIDGVRVGSATAGTTAFETLPLENVERIEIVRGPRSSLYGSDAIGGVIQIFTRDSDAPRASVSTGSHDFRRMSAGYGLNTEDAGFSVDLSAEDTDGIDACENDSTNICGVEPDDDAFNSTNISFRGYRSLTPDLKASGSLLVADTETEFDGDFQNSTEQQQTTLAGKLDWKVTSQWQSRFNIGRSTDESENFLDGTEVSHFDTTRLNFSWQNDIALASSQSVTAGLDFLRDEIDTSKIEVFPPPTFSPELRDFAVTERESAGAFIQHQWSGVDWNTQASLRRDFFDEGFDEQGTDGDKLEDETTGNLAIGYQVSETLRVFSSYGTAFKAPTFNELFFPGFGNPELDPEQSESIEVGLRNDLGSVTWEVTAYRTEIEDLIVNTPTGPENVDEATIQGIEVGVNAEWDQWNASLNADFKDPEDEDTGEQLVRRAKHNFRGSITRSLRTWTLGIDVTVQGERFDNVTDTTTFTSERVRLDSYAMLDLRASWRFAPDWNASFKINNANDANYKLTGIHNTDERNFLIQVKWRPGGSR